MDDRAPTSLGDFAETDKRRWRRSTEVFFDLEPPHLDLKIEIFKIEMDTYLKR